MTAVPDSLLKSPQPISQFAQELAERGIQFVKLPDPRPRGRNLFYDANVGAYLVRLSRVGCFWGVELAPRNSKTLITVDVWKAVTAGGKLSYFRPPLASQVAWARDMVRCSPPSTYDPQRLAAVVKERNSAPYAHPISLLWIITGVVVALVALGFAWPSITGNRIPARPIAGLVTSYLVYLALPRMMRIRARRRHRIPR